jgi:hypothetical protein
MTPAGGVGAFLFAALLVLAPGGTPGHYTPKVGDSFSYSESVGLSNGQGNYTGYTETTYVNGSVDVTGVVPANGTVDATFTNATHYVNSTGASIRAHARGTFAFSDASFLYLGNPENLTGYTNPYVWFYMNDSLGRHGHFFLLNTAFSVVSADRAFELGPGSGRYVATIAASGNGSFLRNDGYGKFTATYHWRAFFDPATGYIVGYDYTENDSNAAGDGFTLTDALYVTSTTYPLTAAAAPSTPTTLPAWELAAIVAGVVILVIVVVVFLVAHFRRRSLPAHSRGGAASYGLPPAPPLGPAPPPVRLAPGNEPTVQQVVVRETVKVNCQYCHSLIDSTATTCPVCGAART